jgi:hypothetical protein
MNMRILLLVPLSSALVAQTANMRVVSITPQQAVIQYACPDAAPATLAVSDDSGLGVTVWDVSGAKFQNSDSDLGRANTITWQNGLLRQIVVGSRSAQVATDGKFYSRSLQANTAHTLTASCTGGPASISFQTLNPPVGNMAPDPVAYHPAGFGNIAWPTVDWTSRTTLYIDPKTGILLRPGTWFNQLQFIDSGDAFGAWYQATGSWTNPANVISGSSLSLATTTTVDPVFVALNASELNLKGSANFAGKHITDLRVKFTGKITGGGTVSFCLTQDSGQNCISGIRTATLTATTSTVLFPASQMVAPFSEWGMTSWPVHDLVQPWTTIVNTAGTTATNTTSAPNGSGTGFFPLDLPKGSKVVINGIVRTVASVANNLKLVTDENLGTNTGVPANGANFGVKIWKTAASGTLSLTVAYDVVFEETPGFAIEDGATDQCSKNQIDVTRNSSGASVASHPVTLCMLNYPDGTLVFAFDAATGEMWQIGQLYTRYGDGFADVPVPATGQMPWHPSDGRILYFLASHQDSGVQVLAKAVYRGDGTPYSTGPLPFDSLYRTVPNGHSAARTTCSSGEQTSGNVCVSLVTDITAGHDLLTQMRALSPLYAHGGMTGPRAIGVLGNYYLFRWPGNGTNGTQDTIYGFSYTNLATGNMDFATDSMFGSPGVKGCAVHTAAAWVIDNRWHGLVCNPLGQRTPGQWTGPFESITSSIWNSTDGVSGTWNSSTNFAANYGYPCPAGVCRDEAVSNTIRVRIAGQLCNSTTPAAAEITAFPCPWAPNTKSMLLPLEVGDTVTSATQITNLGSFVESFTVLRLIENSVNDLDVWLQRAQYGTPGASYPSGWSLALLPTGGSPVSAWWIDTQSLPFGNVIVGGQGGSHNDWCPGPRGTFNFASGTIGLYASPNTPAGVGALPYPLGGWGAWQRLQGNPPNWPGNGRVEYYPSCRQINAPDSEKVWVADWRAYQGGSAPAGGAGTGQDGISISQITAGSRAHVWKAITGYPPNPKILPLESWAGAYIFKDVSSPLANSFTDASNGGNWAVCAAYKPNECVTGSAGGDLYYSSPNTINTSGTVYTNNFALAVPGFANASPIAPWAVQTDISHKETWDRFYRRLTMAFAGPSRNYTFTNWRPTPEGKWGLMPSQYVDGVYPNMFVARVPPWPGYDSVRRDSYQQVPIRLGGGDTRAEIRFGYEENGGIANFYCMPRQEACVSRSDGTLFNFISADGHSNVTCVTGCTITIPAIAGSLLWWQEFRSADNGNTWTAINVPQVLVR